MYVRVAVHYIPMYDVIFCNDNSYELTIFPPVSISIPMITNTRRNGNRTNSHANVLWLSLHTKFKMYAQKRTYTSLKKKINKTLGTITSYDPHL